MLTVEPQLDIVVYVNLVYDLIGVLLEGGSENDYLVVLGHEFNKLNTARSH